MPKALLLLLVLAPGLAAQAQKPVVEVRVEILAEILQGMPGRAVMAREVAETIAANFRSQYRLFVWSPDAQSDTKLIARVTQKAANPLPVVNLDFFLDVHGQPTYDMRVTKAVYASSNMERNLQERNGFKSDLEDTIAAVLKEGFFERFRSQALQRMPIARGATPMPNERTIVIPLSWSAAELSFDAQLRVLFERTDVNVTRRGVLDLSVLTERVVDPHRGMLQGGVRRVIWDTTTLDLTSNWNAQLPQLLSGASIICHVVEYRDRVFGGVGGDLQVSP